MRQGQSGVAQGADDRGPELELELRHIATNPANNVSGSQPFRWPSHNDANPPASTCLAMSATSSNRRPSSSIHIPGSLMSTLDEAMHSRAHNRPAVRRAGNEMRRTLGELITQAQQSGQLRKDIGVGDILLISMILSRREDSLPADIADIIPERFIELAIDGLRRSGSGARALPGKPITRI